MSAGLVSAVGYRRYGGDWGSMVAAKLGAAYPERVAGIHVNMLVAAWVVKKFRTWSDCDGEQVFSRDTLLTNMRAFFAPLRESR